jgi:hypothetical protein
MYSLAHICCALMRERLERDNRWFAYLRLCRSQTSRSRNGVLRVVMAIFVLEALPLLSSKRESRPTIPHTQTDDFAFFELM